MKHSDNHTGLVLTQREGFILLNIRVVPRASRSEIVGESDGVLRVRVASPPVDGAANAEIVKLLAKTLGLAKSQVEIVSGKASRTKQLRIIGVTAEQVRKLLGG